MSKRFITVFILSNDSSKSRQFKLSVTTYKVFRNALIVLALLFAYVCYDYLSMRVENLAFNNLKKKSVAQKIELNEFSRTINNMEKKLARLHIFDKKLRIIANIETADGSSETSMGMGGASLEGVDLVAPREKRNELVDKMHSDLTQINAEVGQQERSFIELQSYLSEQSSLLASTPSVWPVRGWVSSSFGRRKSPFTGLTQTHKGLDIANRLGTSISAPADGIVVFAGRKNALGKAVVIKHGYGLKTTYGHLSKFIVKKGERVKRGQKIAEMGNTGRSTGPHLHYNVSLNGVSVNPMRYILN